MLASILLTLLGALSRPSPAAAQDEEIDLGGAFINFAYAAQLGVGRYRVGELEVSTFKLPIKVPIRRSDGQSWGILFKLPVTFGRYTAEGDFPGLDFFEQADAVSVIPGVELRIPVKPNWRLRPSVDAGIGREFETDRTAVLVSAGILSRASWPLGNYLLSLGNGLTWAANIPTDTGNTISYALLTTGLDARLPPTVKFVGRENRFSLYFMNLHFIPRVEFSKIGREPQDAVDLWELGLTFGSDEARKVVRFFPLRWIGVAYRFGEGFKGIRFTAGFPF